MFYRFTRYKLKIILTVKNYKWRVNIVVFKNMCLG